jgi:hypothetical protein
MGEVDEVFFTSDNRTAYGGVPSGRTMEAVRRGISVASPKDVCR